MKRLRLALCLTVCIGGRGEVLLPDPSIFRDGGTYYLTGTEHQDPKGRYVFPMLQSQDLADWRPAATGYLQGKVLDKTTAFGTTSLWAPQIFKYHDRYYFAYCANFRLALASANRLADGFTAFVDFPAKKGQIDPFVFVDDDGRAYLYCADWDLGGISGAALSDDLRKVQGAAVVCVRNDKPWERLPLEPCYVELNAKAHETYNASDGVVEGPTVLKRHGSYVLFYSANDFRSPDYCVCAAVASSPLGPWRKIQNGPVLGRADTGFNGTGHGDVFFKPDGSMWYVFHTHNSAIRIHPRRTGMIRLVETVGSDGMPRYAADRASLTLF